MDRKPFILMCWLVACSATALSQDTSLFRNPNAPVEDRVEDLLSTLTLEEKVDLCYGNFTSGGVPRLGIGTLEMLDGRQGLRPVLKEKGTKTTLMPCVLAVSCTWDVEAAREIGNVLAEEMIGMKKHVLLAPMLNLVRSPLGGRNFENFGEDPYLVGKLGAAYIKGVQENGVGACSCLLVANDCEAKRHFTSSNMDDRTLRELHLLPYEMSVREGKVWSMMTGNNLLNGLHCAQNRHLIQELMKDEIGFDGVMITDWRAAYDTTQTALAGTDMTTGFCSYVFGNGHLLEAVKEGKVPMSLLDEKARRVLRLYIRSGVLDPDKRKKGGIDTSEHRNAARRLASQAMVLLKNRNAVLPLDGGKLRNVLVTGPAAGTVMQGGGSGSVPAAIEITPLDGLKKALQGATVTHLPYDVALVPGMEKGAVEWEQTTTTRRRARRNAQQTESDIPTPEEMTSAAKAADVVIFVAAGLSASEGRDLPHMNLPGGQADVIRTLASSNPNVVVVLVSNGAVSLDGWEDSASAILAMHYSGEATGEALADVLTGKVSPGGKLSYTFGKRLEDYACHALAEWPARLILEKDPGSAGFTPEERRAIHAYSTEYKEGVFAGHRWFDKENIEPAYPFGFGLSYTSFTLSEMKISEQGDGISVQCTVRNIGQREGSEVVQLYVAPKSSSVPRPIRELAGFSKVNLKPGESRNVSIPLSNSAFAYYDAASRKWKTEAGEYTVEVGTSSRDLPLKSKTTISREALFSSK